MRGNRIQTFLRSTRAMAPGENPDAAEPIELAVERLREAEQTARQNCQLLMDVIDLLPIGVTLQDRKGEVLLANAAAAPAGLSAPTGESEQRIAGPTGEHS